jgi:acyl dehydratase
MGIGIAFGLASRLDLIDGTVVALLGVNWDFRAPMRPGDTIRALIGVTGKRPVKNPDLGLIEWAIELVNQCDKLLQNGSARLLLRKTRPPAADWGQVESGKTG